MGDFYDDGLKFSCQRCSGCCRHEPGYVFLSEEDLRQMCSKLNLTRNKFISKYCSVVNLGGFKRLTLVEKANNDCIFWDKGCTIYEARPLQCRSFPFWAHNLVNEESWKSVASSCPGVGLGELRSKETIEDWLQKRLDEPLITPK